MRCLQNHQVSELSQARIQRKLVVRQKYQNEVQECFKVLWQIEMLQEADDFSSENLAKSRLGNRYNYWLDTLRL